MKSNDKARPQRTLGIIGGMSWESTESYYRLINEGVKAELGGLHSADLLIHSLDFAPIGELQAKGEWAQMGAILASSGMVLAIDPLVRSRDLLEGVLVSLKVHPSMPL